MAYIEFDSNKNVVDFLNDFCMWGGSTKTFENFKMYELPEEVANFMQTDAFKGFLIKNGVKLITENDTDFNKILELVFEK